MTGIDLAHRFYTEVVGPLVADIPHAAALLGDGSEVLGFDDDTSTDHGFGPRLQLFVDDPAGLAEARDRVDRGLPERFDELPVAFALLGPYGHEPHHQVVIAETAAYFVEAIRFDPADGVSLADWLLTPTQRLATLTTGAVFHDPDGGLERRRHALRWFPDDVWRYVLASAWLRVSQEHAFVGRTGARQDELGSRVIAARLVRDLVRLAFLVERRWAPYSKWLGRAFADLPIAGSIGPDLLGALETEDWRARERSLLTVAEQLGHATNALELAEPVDPAPRRFYTRDILVVDAEGFTAALCDAIDDPAVRRLLERLGRRADRPVGRLPGAIDQAIDSTDVLTHPDRCRAAARLLGLEETP